MPASFSIGDFSRAKHLSVKTLRHYDSVGLLEPADVDSASDHRQPVAVAQVIRRFRSLEMPNDEIRAVLAPPDIATRNELLAAHLDRIETSLSRTPASLPPAPALRSVDALMAPEIRACSHWLFSPATPGPSKSSRNSAASRSRAATQAQ
jgi:DNA-binding transcriptional MerR regulator